MFFDVETNTSSSFGLSIFPYWWVTIDLYAFELRFVIFQPGLAYSFDVKLVPIHHKWESAKEEGKLCVFIFATDV